MMMMIDDGGSGCTRGVRELSDRLVSNAIHIISLILASLIFSVSIRLTISDHPHHARQQHSLEKSPWTEQSIPARRGPMDGD